MDQLIKTYTKHLRLPYIHQNLSFHFRTSSVRKSILYEEFLLNLFQYEVELRQQNGVNTRIRAKFPYLKHLEELEVAALPLEAQKHYQTLKSLEFIEKKQNVILAGNPGTGKSHTVIGLGIKACQAGYHVYFAHVPTLIIELKEAKMNVSYNV